MSQGDESTQNDNQRAPASFVKQKLRQRRECNAFIESEKEGECQCGRAKDWHIERKISTSADVLWDPDIHTLLSECSYFGCIHFPGFEDSGKNPAKYVRVEHQTKPEDVWTLMETHWKLPRPNMLISVTGGVKVSLDSQLKDNFTNGLMNVATSTGAWIVTGGTDEGVAKLVGEAVRDHSMKAGAEDSNVVCIGFAAWGAIMDRDTLEQSNFIIRKEASSLKDKESKNSANKGGSDSVKNKGNNLETVKGLCSLDHTHFILVDDGTVNKIGTEVKLRFSMERYVTDRNLNIPFRNTDKGTARVPLVLLVVGGDEKTLETVWQALDENKTALDENKTALNENKTALNENKTALNENKTALNENKTALNENKTAVVVIGSSGGAADFIVEAMELTKNKQNEDEATIPSNFEEAMNSIAQKHFKISSDDSGKLKKCLDSIRKIVNKPFRQLVNVVDLYEEDDSSTIETAILDVVMRAQESHVSAQESHVSAQESHVSKQLELLLAWDKSDIAREKIFNKQPRPHIEVSVLHKLLFPALIQDRVEFVKLFMENGAKFDDYLTPAMENGAKFDDYLTPAELARLYKAFLSKTQDENNDACRMLRTMMNKMLDKKKRNDPSFEDVLRAVGRVLDHRMGAEFKFHVHYEKLANAVAENKVVSNLHKELFLWSLLLNRKDMAMLFWWKGKDHIGVALVGCSLCRHLRDKANSKNYINLASDMDAQADRFEQLGIKVLGNCYQRDKDVTHKLLVRKLRSWQDRTLFSIAGGERQMDFLGQPACQTKLNNIWRGKITPSTSMFRIFCALFIPPLVWTVKMKNDVDDDADIVNEKRIFNNRVGPTNEESSEAKSTNEESPKAKSINEQQSSFETTNKNSKMRRLWDAPISFYTSPIVKFSYDVIAQLIYRALFSYFVLVDLHPINNDSHRASPAHTEFAVWAWTLTLFAEQIRKIWIQEPVSLVSKLKYYFESYWAYFDALVYSMFITSIALRYVLHGEGFMWARILYCVTLSLFYIRFMSSFYVGSLIGPKVIMIGQMMTDLLLFVSLWAIFLLSYGVMLEALRLPGYDNSWARLKRIVYYPYWQMYNVIDSDIQNGMYDACGNATDPDNIDAECQQPNGVIMFICAAYSLLTAILLLNLLIAMFNSTFGRVQDHSQVLWSYYSYKLVYDYFERTFYGPPLTIIGYIWCKYGNNTCTCQGSSNIVGSYKPYSFDVNLSPEEDRQLTKFERTSMEKVMREEERKPDATLNSSSSSDAVVELRQLLNELKKHLRAKKEYSPQSQGQLNDIQQRLKSQEQQFSLVVNPLKSAFGSSSNKQSK